MRLPSPRLSPDAYANTSFLRLVPELETPRPILSIDFLINRKSTFIEPVSKVPRVSSQTEEGHRESRQIKVNLLRYLDLSAMAELTDIIPARQQAELPERHPKGAEKKLAVVRELFLQLLKNYPDGSISIIDRSFNFVYTGGELHQLLHVDPKELMGKEMFIEFPEELRGIIRARLETVFQGAVISDFELSSPLAGHIYIMDAFPLWEEDSSIKRAGVIIRNISRLKKAEEDLTKALEKERELSELKSRFVSMASHEFRTPLSTILSSTYLLSKYTTTEDQPKREKHLERIISSVNTLTDILNDFLSLGKLEEGKLSVRPAEIHVKELMNNIVSEITPVLKPNQVIEYKHWGPENVVLDKGLLKHIVLNLLSNAIKFSFDNSVIEIRTSIKSGLFILSIKDHGIGIPIEDQKHLFERFFRGTNAVNIQGTGLGLHIVLRYTELMNGKLIFRSVLDKGTEFIVRFRSLNTGVKDDR